MTETHRLKLDTIKVIYILFTIACIGITCMNEIRTMHGIEQMKFMAADIDQVLQTAFQYTVVSQRQALELFRSLE
jgi:hypothetical protein